MTLIFITLLLSVVVSGLALAVLLRLAPQTGLMDYPGDRRRLHREAIPRIGGLGIFIGILASLVAVPPQTPAELWSDRCGPARAGGCSG